MPNEISLTDYIAQATQSLFGKIFGPDYLQKQTYLQTTSTTFNQTYGRKVWDALNNKKVSYNAIKKVPWGPTAGWILRSGRGITTTANRTRPVTEVGTLPTINVSTYTGVYSLPKIVATPFGVPVRTQFINTLEGGMGDVMAIELEGAERDFTKEINLMLSAGSAYLVSAGAATTFTVPATIAHHFKIGDTVAMYDIATSAYVDTARAVSGVNTSTGVVTIATGTAFDDGDIAYIRSRAGLTSIDDLCMSDDIGVGGQQAAVDIYNQTTRTAGGLAAGLPSYNAGVGRDLTLPILDARLRAIWEAGGTPRLILVGWDQYYRLQQLLQAQQRFMGEEEFVVGVGDERTLPGTKVSLRLATYQGIPILIDVDLPASVDTSDTVLGQNIYILDTDYLEVAVAQTPQYVENRNYFDANALVIRGLFYSMLELRALRLDVHAKIADLNA